MPRTVEKLIFYLSLIFLSVVYGIGAAWSGWFPSDFFRQAVRQADQILSPPGYLTPRVYDRHGVRSELPERIAPGLTLVASVWEQEGEWTPGLRLIDADGRTVHSWDADPAVIFEDTEERWELGQVDLHVQGPHLFPNGDVLANLEYAGTVRLDACSRVRWSLSEGGHHSISQAEDGTFWIPSVSPQPRIASPDHPDGLPGLKRPIYHEYLRRVSPTGEVLERIHVLDLLYENGLERYVVKASLGTSNDVTHVNDVDPLANEMADEYPTLEAGDLVVSVRNLDLVFVVDPTSREIKWHTSHPFLRQHDPDFMDGGWIGVFDNNRDGTDRGTMLGGSRIIALQPHTDSLKELFAGTGTDTFYTSIMGKWQKLDNGNLLLVESEAGRVVEVTGDGRTVWEWIVPAYDERLVPYVSDARRVDVTRQDVASWPCSATNMPH